MCIGNTRRTHCSRNHCNSGYANVSQCYTYNACLTMLFLRQVQWFRIGHDHFLLRPVKLNIQLSSAIRHYKFGATDNRVTINKYSSICV